MAHRIDEGCFHLFALHGAAALAGYLFVGVDLSSLWLAIPLSAQSNKLIRELEGKRGALQKSNKRLRCSGPTPTPVSEKLK